MDGYVLGGEGETLLVPKSPSVCGGRLANWSRASRSGRSSRSLSLRAKRHQRVQRPARRQRWPELTLVLPRGGLPGPGGGGV